MNDSLHDIVHASVADALRPLTQLVREQRDASRLADLERLLKWIAQTTHQAHHTGPLETCPKATCAAVRDAIGAWPMPKEEP